MSKFPLKAYLQEFTSKRRRKPTLNKKKTFEGFESISYFAEEIDNYFQDDNDCCNCIYEIIL